MPFVPFVTMLSICQKHISNQPTNRSCYTCLIILTLMPQAPGNKQRKMKSSDTSTQTQIEPTWANQTQTEVAGEMMNTILRNNYRGYNLQLKYITQADILCSAGSSHVAEPCRA